MGKAVEVGDAYDAETVALRIVVDLLEDPRRRPTWEDFPWFTEGSWGQVDEALWAVAHWLRQTANDRDESTRTDSLFIMQEAAN